MTNTISPYTTPSMPEGYETQGADPAVLRAIAVRLAEAKANPPTMLGQLCRWPGAPALVLVGAIGTATLAYVAAATDSPFTSHWPLGFAAMTFGALLRDIGLARRSAKLWTPQTHFIDWQKVEEFTSYDSTNTP